MLEVEVRYRTPDRAAVVDRLTALGAERVEERSEADLYFEAPDRDLKARDEALRLRRSGPRNVLTFKGPRRDAGTKTRPEVEVPLADGAEVAAAAERLLGSLGYRPLATVRKRREVYRLVRDGFRLEVCFDEVERVGSFVELEVVVAEELCGPAQAVLLRTAAELGLTDAETRSYLALVLQASAGS
jgi:adenylate cyclase class 2